MDVWVSELKCLMCGEIAGYYVEGKNGDDRVTAIASRVPLESHRCPRCKGPLYTDPSHEQPRDLGIDVSRFFPDHRPYDAPEPPSERRCVGCGAPVQRAERCRRCYLRYRYATNPAVRAKQLALQARWRKRQATLRGRTSA